MYVKKKAVHLFKNSTFHLIKTLNIHYIENLEKGKSYFKFQNTYYTEEYAI